MYAQICSKMLKFPMPFLKYVANFLANMKKHFTSRGSLEITLESFLNFSIWEWEGECEKCFLQAGVERGSFFLENDENRSSWADEKCHVVGGKGISVDNIHMSQQYYRAI